ncbi:hypothetical protein PMI09_00674 [Rhizobium sp. CF122]|nr:hypothetical protein [Rhizobium sp. CF122]EJL57969.1 hypothetical protein PMI09_00674 [Rhizobium sp. CF122]
MGLSPHEVMGLSIFEYLAALDGHIEATDPEVDKKLTEVEKDDLWEWLSS